MSQELDGLIQSALLQLRSDYAQLCRGGDIADPRAPISEADIVSDIRLRLADIARQAGCTIYQEIRAVPRGVTAMDEIKYPAED